MESVFGYSTGPVPFYFIGENTFIRLFADYITLIMSFVASVIITHNRVELSFDTHEAFLFLSLPLVWFMRGKAIGLYDEYRSRNFSFELIAII